MRILHTNFLKGWGGQSNRVLMEGIGAAEAGHDVLLSVPRQSELARRAMEAGLSVDGSVKYAGGFRPQAFRDVGAFRALLTRFQPDIIHLHGGRDSWVAAMALFWHGRASRPRIIRCKHNVFPVSGHPANRWIYGSFFEHIICLSNAIVEQCAGLRGVKRGNLSLIPSACDAGRFAFNAEARQRVRAELGAAPGDIVSVSVGRLRPEKDYPTLIRAAALTTGVKFFIVGGGSDKGALQDMAEESGVADRVTITGFREDVPAVLSAADFVTHPAISEGLGTSVLEACAAGRAVVATRVGGIPDIITDGETGLLVPPGDAQALAMAIMRVAGDEALRARLGGAAAKRVAEHFSVEALVTATLRCYDRVVAAGRP